MHLKSFSKMEGKSMLLHVACVCTCIWVNNVYIHVHKCRSKRKPGARIVNRQFSVLNALAFYKKHKWHNNKKRTLTWIFVRKECLEDVSQLFYIGTTDFVVIHDGCRVVLSYDASCRSLYTLRCCPGSMDIFCREPFQDWQVFSENNLQNSAL